MKINKKLVTTVVVIVITLIFLLPAIGFSILNWGVLPPEKLTPLVIEKTNQFLDAHLECERIELTYFETYPYLGIRLTNGRLISHAAQDSTAHKEALAIPSDSLLSFGKAIVSIQPMEYLFERKITIKNLFIDSPRIYGYVNKAGRANWEIYQSEADSAINENEKQPLPPIDLQKVRIRNGHFTYDDQSTGLYTQVDGFFLKLDGSLSYGRNKLDVETGISSLLFRNPTYTLKNKLALNLKSQLVLADNFNSITLKNAELFVNNLPFTADGSIYNHSDQQKTRIDMKVGMKVSDMNDLLKFIPEIYFRNREKTLATGAIVLEGSIHGELGDSLIPDINLCCKVENGSYHLKGVKQGIEKFEMDLDLHLNGSHPDSSFVSLEQLTLKGMNTSLDMQGKVTNIFRNPAITTSLQGNIDFTGLGKEFLNPDTLLIEGGMNANLSASFTIDDLVNSRYNKVKASGNLQIDSLKTCSKPLDMDVYMAGARLAIDSARNESAYLNKKDLLTLSFSMDSLNLNYKENIRTNVSKLLITANTTPVIDTTAVIPLTAMLQFDRLQTRLPDSVWLVAGRTVLRGGIKPSVSNQRIPTAGASITVDTLKYFMIPLRTGMVLTESTFGLEALPLRDVWQQRRNRQEGLTRTSRARTNRPNRIPTDSTANTNQFLRRWEIRGNVQLNRMFAFSRLFPLPMRMEKTRLDFNTNNITLTDARLQVGKSNFILNGEISHLRQAMLRGGILKGNVSLSSDYIDCNQILLALNKGMTYAEQRPAQGDAEDLALDDLNVQILQDSTQQTVVDTTGQLFIVPKNLDMIFSTNAKRIDFKDLQLENVQGDVIIRDQSINLSNLAMHSNMGCGNLTMAYTAKDKQEASTGFDLQLEKMQVEKLIGLFPSIDTLVPMLRSFEGVVDCQIAATCKLDSTLSLKMPTLHSACYLHGENMVLLDGETFTEISKTLMFKNKKRNMIDSISVDLSIKDNKIEVYPFLIEMDRYKVAVGGTHNLDMTFNYHLSVLKSPVPFKLGIDITGNLDDFKFKIVKCRYKDLFKPAKQAELDSTRTNVRKHIRDAIRKQIEEAAPELAGSLTASHIHTHASEEKENTL